MLRSMCNQPGCCRAAITPYTRRWVPTEMSEIERKTRKKKAGVFVYDPARDKLLLVQSCGRFWGPPKGSMEVGEDIQSTAARELMEETGVSVHRDELTQRLYLRNCSHYYFFHTMPETVPQVIHTNDPNGNDANSVGWFSVACLKSRLEEGKMIANSALKQFLNSNVLEKVLAARIAHAENHKQADEAEEDKEKEGAAASSSG